MVIVHAECNTNGYMLNIFSLWYIAIIYIKPAMNSVLLIFTRVINNK